MKKLMLTSVLVVAASSAFAAEDTTTTVPAKTWSETISGCVPVCVSNAHASVTKKMSENPWTSAAVVAVSTILVVKAVDYALQSEDEEAGF